VPTSRDPKTAIIKGEDSLERRSIHYSEATSSHAGVTVKKSPWSIYPKMGLENKTVPDARWDRKKTSLKPIGNWVLGKPVRNLDRATRQA
jgi:hypothetical protein